LGYEEPQQSSVKDIEETPFLKEKLAL